MLLTVQITHLYFFHVLIHSENLKEADYLAENVTFPFLHTNVFFAEMHDRKNFNQY